MEVKSWDGVDSALKRLGEIEIIASKINGDATLEINTIKERAKKEAAGLEAEKVHLEKLITIYCESQKAEFAKKRSKEFNFGVVGFRTVRSVSIPRDKVKTAALLKSLKAFGLSECIAYEEKPDKEKIEELADETIVKLGLKRTVKDSFRISPAIEKIGEML